MVDATWTVALAGISVEVSGLRVGAKVGARVDGVETVAVVGRAEGVEPEQAATATAKIDRKSIEAHRRLIFL